MTTSIEKLKSGGTMLVQWDEGDVRRLPLNALRILDVFVTKNKEVLSTEEISEALKGKLEGKNLGGTLAIFSKYKNKAPLLGFLIKINQNNSLWEIKKGNFLVIKRVILKVRKYLDEY